MTSNLNNSTYNPFNEKSRSDWASLEWSDAQKRIGDLLSECGYHEYQEYRLPKNKRADIIVWKESQYEMKFGIVEVKSYKRISPSIITKAKNQIIRYFTLFVNDLQNKPLWNKKSLRFFLAIVFTKDYPGLRSNDQTKHVYEISNQHLEPKIILCTPEKLVFELVSQDFIDPKQTNIEKYFKNYS